ncbi:MAG: UDP-N-acetylmuramoyl-L-alanyl-D-glutamate--2,6-diaminopimelate ligase, partial [Clostridia bacterium]|nr:UDP-N-acetylmuramoyl-L-alanyl-D-glutamate--2,6-diaminopimelate ligase [Clostridia bacterium]
MISHILNGYGIKTGVIGTLGVFYGDVVQEPTLTTPDPPELFKILREMVDDGVKVAVMEVSAHAGALKKIDGIKFQLGVFTNFTRDHLDYFGDMESYKQAKLRFFNNERCENLIVKSDDVLGRGIIKNNEKTVSYGIENPADAFAINLKSTPTGESFVVNLFDKIFNVKLPVCGRFNVYNALASMVACSTLKVPTKFIVENVSSFSGASGRLEKIIGKNFSVFVDYAHTPDGLEKSLTALKEITEGKLICVFGCGGNRDKGKREEMGKVSGNLADFTVITSDNPRFEEPMSIIRNIEKGGLELTEDYVVIENRENAIRYALKMATPSD